MLCGERSKGGEWPYKKRGERRERLHRGKGLAGLKIVLLALKPDPLVNARCGDVVAHEVCSDVVVREVGVQNFPRVRYRGAAKPQKQAGAERPLHPLDMSRLHSVRRLHEVYLAHETTFTPLLRPLRMYCAGRKMPRRGERGETQRISWRTSAAGASITSYGPQHGELSRRGIADVFRL